MHSLIHRLRRFAPILIEEAQRQFVYFFITLLLLAGFILSMSMCNVVFNLISSQFGIGVAVFALICFAFFLIWIFVAISSAYAKYTLRYKSKD